MIEFCLIVGNQPREMMRNDLSAFCSDRPEREISFRVAGKNPLSVSAFWSESHPAHNFHDIVRVDENGFSLLAGYPLDQNMRPIRSVAMFDPGIAKDYGGDFFYLSISAGGSVSIAKSTICSYQIYVSKGQGYDVLASRSSLAAVASGNTKIPKPNIDFARWICTYGGGGNRAAAFQKTDVVLSNQSVSIKENRLEVSRPNYGFLIDHEMSELYERSPKKYWDDIFEYLLQSTAVLDFSDKEIDFSLSGGKDSRLLLGLIAAGGRRERIRRIFTNGPSISPEVRSAQMVCDVLGLKHEFVDQTDMERPQGFQIDDKLPRHVHITEGEMSLSDITWNTRKSDKIELHGIESGLRNVYQKRDNSTREKLLNWFDIHLARGDKCQLFANGYADQNMDEVRDFVDGALGCGVSIEDIPTLHRALLRSGRWVSRTWRAYNDRHFAPYIFVNEKLIKATYNCGEEARAREEFHFEMQRRIAPNLIEVPFYGQSWDPALAQKYDAKLPEQLNWPVGTKTETTRNTHLALHGAFDDIKSFLLSHQGDVTNILLDRDRLRQFEIDGAHPSIYMAFWNFIQIAILEKAPDLEVLSSGIDVTELGLPSFNY